MKLLSPPRFISCVGYPKAVKKNVETPPASGEKEKGVPCE
jgi:hypothetical protein